MQEVLVIGGLTFWAAGSTCTDHSPANQQFPGIFGETLFSLIAWCQSVACHKPDIFLHECTPGFPLWLLEQYLGGIYTLQSRIWCPTDLGIPARRKRRYTLGFRKETMVEAAPAFSFSSSGFERLVYRTIDADAISFWWSGQSLAMANRLAKNRRVYQDLSHMSMDDLMPVAGIERRRAYERLARLDPQADSKSWFAKLDQNPDATLSPSVLPTLLRKSELFCLSVGLGAQINRYMEVEEMMTSLLLPAPRYNWGACDRRGDTVGPSHELGCSEAWASISSISIGQGRSICGNGMSLIQVGLCIMIALATHAKREMPAVGRSLHSRDPEHGCESDSDLD